VNMARSFAWLGTNLCLLFNNKKLEELNYIVLINGIMHFD
jgi:hypothetical protein